ncbi:MAG TPA: oligosaccharide flippase family protein [Solirubrobacterales bacterium]|nr:oligosaccharide flippase family protein [Solirubrobacterales bacterium]
MSDGGRNRTRPGGSGAVLGARVIRYSSIFTGGLVVTNLIAFASTIVLANLLSPAEFGQLALLLFLAGLLTLIFNLGSKQGTIRRVFGADDDEDDDDEDDDGGLSEASQRSLGTGIVLTTLLSLLGAGLVVVFATEVADLLLGGGADRELVLWAGLAGATGAVYRLASRVVWMERRPIAYVILESAQPLLVLAVVVPLVATGAGLEGAIAGTAIGTAASTVLAVIALRGSFELRFEPREALTIMRLGSPRIPVHTSFWTINSAQIFFLSRYVSHADLGLFALAQRVGIVVSLLPHGFRRALKPLKRTMAYASMEEEYGSDVTRGQQLGYFLLVTLASLLAVTLFADPLVSLAPPAYADAAPLIPLMSAAMIAPVVFRMVNKAAKYRRKRPIFVVSAVAAGVLFVIGCLTLIPWLGLEGAPAAMMLAFAAPGAYIFYLSQTGKEPIVMPYRSLALAAILAAACAVGYYAINPAGIVAQIALGLALLAAWAALALVTGVIPSYHRGPLIHMARTAIGRGPAKFDPERALRGLEPGDRETLRLALVERLPLQEVGSIVGADDGAERVARALRRAAEEGGAFASGGSEHDAAIAEYLFSTQTIATRDQMAKRLTRDEGVSPGDLRELESVRDDLAGVPKEEWPPEELAASADSPRYAPS